MSEQMTFEEFLAAKTEPAPDTKTDAKQASGPDPVCRYYEINEELARRAHEMMSMSDYVPGSATEEYRASVDAAAALSEDKKSSVSPFYRAKIDHLLDIYARKLAAWTNDYNRNGASCPSVLVCGPANFPTKKKNRQIAREDALWKEYDSINGILDKIRHAGTGPVDLTDPHAREMLQEQLEKLQADLDHGKAMNAYYRKHKTFAGFPGMSDEAAAKLTAEFEDTRARCPWVEHHFPSYELASLRGKIKRVKARLAELDKLESKKDHPDDATAFEGGEIVRNADLNRLQIVFEEVPDMETRNALKQNGFHWSPKNKAWQRQLTDNAEYAARRVLGLA